MPTGPTRVLPQAYDGAVLYLQGQGAFVGKRSEHLVVRKDGAELQRIPLAAHIRDDIPHYTGFKVR